MIATGNHNFERFAALCNTPGGSQGHNFQLVPFNERLNPARLRADSIRPYSGICVQPAFWYSISIVMKKIDFPQPDWYTRNKKEVIS